MTKEQAYEKLELPIDTDLQVVRQKFQQMHNDFQVQIDGSFSAEMRQRKEKQLEELKEAFAMLNESANMDDSASLPRTEQTFEHTKDPITKSNILNLSQALALFGLKENQGHTAITQTIYMYISDLQDQLHRTNISAVQQVLHTEIFKANEAKLIIDEWMSKRSHSSDSSSNTSSAEQASPHQSSSKKTTLSPNNKTTSWYYFLTILLLGSGLLLLIELIFSGEVNGIYAYAIGVIITSTIILNYYAPTLVPPYLRRDWISGKSAWKGILLLLFSALGTGLLTTVIDHSGYWDINPSISSFSLNVIYAVIYLLIMGLGGTLGLIDPSIIYFKSRMDVFASFVMLVVVHLVTSMLISALLVLPQMSILSDSVSFSDTPEWDSEWNTDSVHVEVDSVEISEIDYLLQQAKEGDPIAQFNLGYKYANGEEVEKDYTKAFDWYMKSALQGDKDAQNNLGVLYAHGEGVTASEKEAIKWFKKAAKQGDETAIENLKGYGITKFD